MSHVYEDINVGGSDSALRSLRPDRCLRAAQSPCAACRDGPVAMPDYTCRMAPRQAEFPAVCKVNAARHAVNKKCRRCRMQQALRCKPRFQSFLSIGKTDRCRIWGDPESERIWSPKIDDRPESGVMTDR